MEQQIDTQLACLRVVAAANRANGWQLDDTTQQIYAAVVQPHLLAGYSQSRLRRIVEHFHSDHGIVEALTNHNHPQHNQIWSEWALQTLRIILHHRYHQYRHILAESDDLVQAALEALAQALPNFQYLSRFTTWAYAIIVNRTRSYLRDLAAAKRDGASDSLEQLGEHGASALRGELLHQIVEARALLKLIYAVLAADGNLQRARVFYLRVAEDQRLIDISRRVELSPARVSILVSQARQVLRTHPEVRHWFAEQGDSALMKISDSFVDDVGGTSRDRV